MKEPTRTSILLFACLAGALNGACGDDSEESDAGVVDAGVVDAGETDGAASDAGRDGGVDAGPVNLAPVLGDSSHETREDTPIAIELEVTDDGIDDGGVTLAVVGAPTDGTATLDGTTLTYTPDAGFVGSDAVQLEPSDGLAAGATATVTIGVTDGSVYFVAPDGDDTASGLTRAEALATIVEALGRTDEDADEVVLLAGTHRPAATIEIDTGFTTSLRADDGLAPEDVVVDFGGAESFVRVRDTGTTLAGFSIRGSEDEACLFIAAGARVDGLRVLECTGGGARVLTEELVEIEGSAFLDNTALQGAGLFQQAQATGGGEITVRGCRFEGNTAADRGGGILARAPMLVEGSEFIDNHGGEFGGAIFTGSEMTIRDSAFVGNAAERGGGAIYAGAGVGSLSTVWIERSSIRANDGGTGAGALRTNRGEITVVSSTIAENVGNDGPNIGSSALYAGLSTDRLQLVFVTLLDNRAGPSAPSDVPLFNTSIVELAYVASDNPGVDDCRPADGVLDVAIESRSSDETCLALAESERGVDLGLQPLADNGGPTLTALPAASSLLVDAVALESGACPRPAFLDASAPFDPADQRRVVRPEGAGCDIGAVEDD